MAGYNYFKDRIEKYSGDIDSWHSIDLNPIGDGLAIEGFRWMVGMVESQAPSMLHLFSTKQESDTSGNTNGWSSYTYSMTETDKLGSVFLEDYSCLEVPPSLERQVKDSGSLYYAIPTSPVILKRNGVLYVFPTGGSRKASVDVVQFPSAIDISATIDVSNCPEDFYHIIILYVAKFLLNYKLYLLQTLLPSLSSTSATPSASGIGFEKVRDYIETEEDTELAQIKLSQLQLEAGQIQAEYQWIQGQMAIADSELNTSVQTIIGTRVKGISPASSQETAGEGGR